jgi:lauroyl/myristoyl acyltransferase
VAGAPIVPVFAVRTGIRRYQIQVIGRFAPKTPADSVAALAATVRAYERLVRAVPEQWLMFEDVWGARPASARAADEMVTQAAEL